jgi:hypothetical protein
MFRENKLKNEFRNIRFTHLSSIKDGLISRACDFSDTAARRRKIARADAADDLSGSTLTAGSSRIETACIFQRHI